MKRVVCRELWWSTAFADPASRVFTNRFEDERPLPAKRTSLTAERDVTVRTGKGSRCVVVCIGAAVVLYILFGWTCAAVNGLIYFILNFGRSLSTAWYILIGIFSTTVYGMVYFSPDGKWSCEKMLLKIVAIYRKLKYKKVKIFGRQHSNGQLKDYLKNLFVKTFAWTFILRT